MITKSLGVRFKNVHPSLLWGLLVFEEVYKLYVPDRTMVITSVNDGTHDGTTGYDPTKTPPSDSLHYEGRACDVRANDISHQTAYLIREKAKLHLDADFDILAHGVADSFHFHIELDPKDYVPINWQNAHDFITDP